MSEPESVCTQIFVGVFVRFIGGGLAIVVGTGLTYRLIIRNYLERLERYKEQLRVCKELYGHSRNAIQGIESYQGYPDSVDQFSDSMDTFTQYCKGENDLFMPTAVNEQCQTIISAHESVVDTVKPDQYLESGDPVRYSEERLANLSKEFCSLNDMIRNETASIGLRVPAWFTEWYKDLVPRLPGWCRKVWTCLRSGNN